MVSEVSLSKYTAMGIYLPKKRRRGRNHIQKTLQNLLPKTYSLVKILSGRTRSVFLRKIRERIKLPSLLHCKSNTQGLRLVLFGQERSPSPQQQRTKAALVLLSTSTVAQ